MQNRRRSILFLILLPLLIAAKAETSPSLIQEQRRLFIETYARAELGDWRPAALHDAVLKGYVLWPDLRAAWLKTRIRNGDYAEVDGFLDQFGTLKPARDLRYRYALALAADQKFADYLAIYERYYQGLEIANLDCLALQAEIAAGHGEKIAKRGNELWLIGRNQVDECDPVFDYLRTKKFIESDQYIERFNLAISEREFAIARYLAKSLPRAYQDRAAQWTDVSGDPGRFLEHHDKLRDSAEYRDQLAYAAERLAYKQPETANTLWRDVEPQYDFEDKLKNHIEIHIALWSARRHVAGAASLLASLAPDAENTEVYRWQARTALMKNDWHTVTAAIGRMPAGESESEQWQYWLAHAEHAAGNEAQSQRIFSTLARERSYYGFLAADQLGQRYNFSDEPLQADESIISALERTDTIVRALELYRVGQEGRGRSEWDAAVAMLSENQKRQASLLAHRWGWHSQAISTAAGAGHLDDMQLRYPLPYRAVFEKYSRASQVADSWAYGISRSESMFMRDVRSSAGAIGLMQLMPETGRRTAAEINLPYTGTATLTDPDANIRLGTAYLGMMLQRFDDNRVLATAAYNAGPQNVEEWLPSNGSVDPKIWIENIPYDETRRYVRRVLMTDTIFNWRLSGDWQRLSPKMTPISAPAERVADSSNQDQRSDH